MAAWLGGRHGQPDELRGPGAAGAEEGGQAGGVPRADGRDRAMGQVVRPGGAQLPFPGARQACARRGDDAQDVPAPGDVRPLGRGHGGCHPRLPRHAEVHAHRPHAGAGAGRDGPREVPPCPREGGARQGHAPRSRCPARGGGDHDAGRLHRGCRLHRGAGLHEEQGPRAAPRRTSPGRAGTGISDARRTSAPMPAAASRIPWRRPPRTCPACPWRMPSRGRTARSAMRTPAARAWRSAPRSPPAPISPRCAGPSPGSPPP